MITVCKFSRDRMGQARRAEVREGVAGRGADVGRGAEGAAAALAHPLGPLNHYVLAGRRRRRFACNDDAPC